MNLNGSVFWCFSISLRYTNRLAFATKLSSRRNIHWEWRFSVFFGHFSAFSLPCKHSRHGANLPAYERPRDGHDGWPARAQVSDKRSGVKVP